MAAHTPTKAAGRHPPSLAAREKIAAAAAAAPGKYKKCRSDSDSSSDSSSYTCYSFYDHGSSGSSVDNNSASTHPDGDYDDMTEQPLPTFESSFEKHVSWADRRPECHAGWDTACRASAPVEEKRDENQAERPVEGLTIMESCAPERPAVWTECV